MTDLVDSLVEEGTALWGTVKLDTRNKLAALISVAAAYGMSPSEYLGKIAGVDAPSAKKPRARKRSRSKSPAKGSRVTSGPTKSDLALAVVRSHLEQNGYQPIPTREAVTIVKAAGREVGGKNEVATMSAMFSNSDEWENVKGEGWRLISHRKGSDNELPGLETDVDETMSGFMPGMERPAMQASPIHQSNGMAPVSPTSYGGVRTASVAPPVAKGLSAEGPQT